VTTLDVYTGCGSLGVSIVGGIDTPLVSPYTVLYHNYSFFLWMLYIH